MTFGDILNKASARAFQMGKTLVFGGTEVQNVAANEISDDFFTLDVSSGSIRSSFVAWAYRRICAMMP